MGRAFTKYGGRTGADKVLVRKPEGKRSVWKPTRRLEDNTY